MKRTIALVAAIALLISGVVMSVFNVFQKDQFEDLFSSLVDDSPVSVIEEGDPSNRIAVISVDGVIQDTPQGSGLFSGVAGYNHRLTVDALKEIIEDDSVKAILLDVNSPGGGVFESAEVYKYLKIAKDKGKIIYSSMGNMAASGGYYVSAPANKIYASNETITGSIGVIMQSIDYSELAEKYGVKFNTYTSGDMKDMLSGAKTPSKEEKEYVQHMVDTMFDEFVKVVAEGRNMSEEEVRKLADGRVYLGSDAIENGLVDEIGYFDDALADLKEEIGSDNPQVYTYGYGSGRFSMFNFNGPSIVKQLFNDSDALIVENLINKRQGPKPMYLYDE